MNLFKNKDSSRKIGPKFGENYKILENEFKPRLYEDQINFDRMRMYRLNRIKEQLLQNDIVSSILVFFNKNVFILVFPKLRTHISTHGMDYYLVVS